VSSIWPQHAIDKNPQPQLGSIPPYALLLQRIITPLEWRDFSISSFSLFSYCEGPVRFLLQSERTQLTCTSSRYPLTGISYNEERCNQCLPLSLYFLWSLVFPPDISILETLFIDLSLQVGGLLRDHEPWISSARNYESCDLLTRLRFKGRANRLCHHRLCHRNSLRPSPKKGDLLSKSNRDIRWCPSPIRWWFVSPMRWLLPMTNLWITLTSIILWITITKFIILS
jgi:hypothetical protein